MPNETQPAAHPGADQAKQQQELLMRLMSRISQPRMAGPQLSQPPKEPKGVSMMQGPAQTRDEGAQMLVHNLFGLVANLSAQNKKTQLDHATNRIKGISDAITDSYEMAQNDPEKAKQLFMESPAVKSLMSKEGQKDMKQMEKLLQYDFI